MADHHVDRPQVQAQRCVQLSGTNRPTGLISSASNVPCSGHPPLRNTPTHTQDLNTHQPRRRTSTAWWLWRGVNTRSHPELGRENPQRPWYCVSRRGRVGRRQAFQVRPTLASSQRYSRSTLIPAGWSSPVARQAHNLKAAGSNPAPATNLQTQSPAAKSSGALCVLGRSLLDTAPQIVDREIGHGAHAVLERGLVDLEQR